MKTLVNITLFQAGWFVMVAGVANQSEVTAILCVILIILAHLFIVRNKTTEVLLVATSGLLGFIIESIFISQGIFSAVGEFGLNGLAPVWLVTLWMLFAITVNHSMAWLSGRYLLSSLLGFVFAPVAYFAGQKFEVLTFTTQLSIYQVLLILGVVWAFITPFLIFISQVYSNRRFVLTN